MGSDEASAKKEPMETLETPSAALAIQQKDDEAIIAYKDDIVYGDDDQEDMKARAAAWACVEVKDREEPYSSGELECWLVVELVTDRFLYSHG